MRPVVVVGVKDRRSLPTLVWAADEAAGRGGEVVVVHAYPHPVVAWEYGHVVVDDDREWLTQLVDEEWCRALRVRGVPYRVVVAPGPAPAVLRLVAAREQASVLVVGRRPHRRFRPVRPIARLLADRSPCPVAVVPGVGEAIPSWLFAPGPHGKALITSAP